MSTFGLINTIVLTIYLTGMVSIGLCLVGRQRTTDDYFLAGRNLPWLAVGMSMFASLTSATTFMGVPAFAYQHNIAMIFGVAMSLVTAPILATVFYPLYRRHKVTTSYEYIRHRFGQTARFVVSGLFVLARLGWLGIVIYAPAQAMAVAAGMPLLLAIGLMGLLAVTYTVMGGLAAVIWTDVIQFVILFVGAVWLVVSLCLNIPGGVTEIVHTAAQSGKFDVFHWTDFSQLTALSAMIGWFFVFLNDYGTDQVTVQRLIAIRTDKGVVKAIAFNAVNDLLINGMLIFIGIGIFTYFKVFPERFAQSTQPDGLLPFYIMHALPPGISGLVMTAIFAAAMSSVDSGINSLSTVIVTDFIKPLFPRILQRFNDIAVARLLTVVLGIVATLTAVYAAGIGNIVQMWMQVMGLFAAPILAIFVLGMLTQRACFAGWLIGAGCGIGLTVYLQQYQSDRLMEVWYFPVSFVVTTLLGYTASLCFDQKNKDTSELWKC